MPIGRRSLDQHNGTVDMRMNTSELNTAMAGLDTSRVNSTRVERLLREREMRRTQSSVSLDHSARELEFGSRAASYVAQAHSHSNPNMTPTPAHLYAVGSGAGASAAAASLEAVYRHSVFPPHGIQEGWDNEEGEDWQECEMQRPGSLPTHLHPRLPAARLGSRKSSFDSSAGTGICSPPTTAEHLQHTPQVPLSGGGGKASRRSSQAFSAPSSGDGVQRLLVVANRLPVSARLAPDGTWFLEKSAGGLVSALLGIHSNYNTTWIGWPGIYVEEGASRDALTAALAEENCWPVYIEEDTVDLYYNGYCNNVLWPLFHYVPLPLEARLAETKNLHQQWQAYSHANELFAEAIMHLYEEGDVVWCHDYHLLLLPKLLKEMKPNMKVGWFLHTPFPSSEIYRALPRREEILQGVLKADLIGFHTYDYARHFVSACTRILGLEGTPEGVEDNGAVTRVAAFPIGIDPERFTAALETEQVKEHMRDLRERFAGRKVMLGVDRLDMIKGIPQKLLAYEMFLDENPEWCDHVLLVQIAVPSRTHVPEYQRLASLVHEMVGRINGRFGALASMPIHHLDRSLSFHELCALYALTDVALVTPVRDGMNLVSYEVVACQSKNAGVLVLSEFAGAAQSLGAGAILVNPWNVSELAGAIEEALTMGDTERRERHRQNFMHVNIHTAQAWADTFISELNDTHVEAELRIKHTPPQLDVPEVVESFCESKERLIVMGYNASTLTTQTPTRKKREFDQVKAMARVHPAVYDALSKLCAIPHTTVVIFSGSGRARLEETFQGLPLWLAAENGVFVRPAPSDDTGVSPHWITNAESMNMDWLESVQLVFDYFCERTPRSFVETRETSLVWNYKYADPEFGMIQARDLLQHLVTGPISNAPVDVIQGTKSVEVRQVGVSKGAAMDRIIASAVGKVSSRRSTSEFAREGVQPVDFVLCMGHFLGRDEDIFAYFEDCMEGAKYRNSEKERQAAWEANAAMGDGEEVDTGLGKRRHTIDCSMDPPSTSGLAIPNSTDMASPLQRELSLHEELLSPSSRSPYMQRMYWEDIPTGLATNPDEMVFSSAFPSNRETRKERRQQAVAGSDRDRVGRTNSKRDNDRSYPGKAMVSPKHLYTCTVSRKRSQARYYLQESSNVVELLQSLAQVADTVDHEGFFQNPFQPNGNTPPRQNPGMGSRPPSVSQFQTY